MVEQNDARGIGELAGTPGVPRVAHYYGALGTLEGHAGYGLLDRGVADGLRIPFALNDDASIIPCCDYVNSLIAAPFGETSIPSEIL